MKGMDSILPSVVAVIVAVVASIPGILAYRHKQRQVDSEADATIADAAIRLIEPYEDRIARLEKRDSEHTALIDGLQSEVADLRRENVELRHGIDRLCHQIESLGQTPVYSLAPT